jgi:tRNA (guanine-N(7)-)-methyltransferase subunit TRM82
MPKRICAVALTKDGKTIVAGDKFGDVYSLPLFPSEEFHLTTIIMDEQHPVPEFKPSASELTVHTKGNLEALRQQQLQKRVKPKKEGLDFEHKLLLGHVSLLTDLAIAEVAGDHSSRQFILTADRDEHIRVSRGITQAHVIENYCLGHTDFVSRLCVLPWQPTTLLAGSGEPSLKVYDWQRGICSGDLLAQSHTLDEIAKHIKDSGQDRSVDRLAVSGIWTKPISDTQGFIMVALEGLPLLLSYFHDGEDFTRTQILELLGNVLDIAVASERSLITVAIDTVHDPYSMKHTRTKLLDQGEGAICFELDRETYLSIVNSDPALKVKLTRCTVWQRSEWFLAIARPLCDDSVMAAVELEEGKKQQKPHDVCSKLGEFLYGLENLRKQRGQEAGEAEEGVVADRNDIAQGDETIE